MKEFDKKKSESNEAKYSETAYQQESNAVDDRAPPYGHKNHGRMENPRNSDGTSHKDQ